MLLMACNGENESNGMITMREGIEEKELIKWENHLKTEISSLVIDQTNNEIIIAESQGGLFWVDLQTGEVNNYKKYDEKGFSYVYLRMNEDYIVAANQTCLFVIDRITNEIVYTNKYLKGNLQDVEVVNDSITVATKGYKITNISFKDFSVNWEFEEEYGSFRQDLEIHEDKVLFTGRYDKYIELNLKDGNVITKIESDMAFPFLVDDEMMYRIGNNKLHKYNLGKNSYEWIIGVSDNNIIRITNTGRFFVNDLTEKRLYEVNVKNGEKKMLFESYEHFLDEIVELEEGNLLIRNSDGTLKLFNEELKKITWDYQSIDFGYNCKKILVNKDTVIIPEDDGLMQAIKIKELIDRTRIE